MKKQLQIEDERFNRQLTDAFEQWTSRAEEMGRTQIELEQQLRESLRIREEKEEKTREVLHLR